MKLKPCPFCGSEGIFHNKSDGSEISSIECVCGVDFSIFGDFKSDHRKSYENRKKDADKQGNNLDKRVINAWNTRRTK